MTEESKENVFLFIPNIIGYLRILLAFVSFYFMPTNYVAACVCYVTSALLDAVDGHAARIFNQSSRFGAMLDMLTDRCGTTGLLAVLCHFYPKYLFFFQLSIAIDISCHWIYLHSQLLQGRGSHKFCELGDNPIMAFYYKKVPLTLMCGLNEGFYSSLYLLHFIEGPALPGLGIGLWRAVVWICGPFAVLKAAISLVHGAVAASNLTLVDLKERALVRSKEDPPVAQTCTKAGKVE